MTIFTKIYSKLRKFTPSGFVESKINSTLSMSALDVAIDVVTGNQVEGDYLEFGVYKGASMSRAYKKFKSNKHYYSYFENMKFYAFDSFEGLPESEEENLPIQYSKGAYMAPLDEFISNLKKKKVDINKVVPVEGWFSNLNDDTKAKFNMSKAAVIYCDADLYESTIDALTFCTSLIQDGTIIVLDDYYRHNGSPNLGIRRAFNEFMSTNPNFISTQLHNFRRVAFIINLKTVE